MKIGVLVDLSTICGKAVEFGGKLAAKVEAELVLIHVTELGESESAEVNTQLEKLKNLVPKNVTTTVLVESGDFFSILPSIVTGNEIDLVVTPTHGKVGIMQNLFGANILKVVQMLPVASLVVQADSSIDNNFDQLLFPVGPHSDFDVKIKETAAFAKIFNSTVIIYAVRNDVRGLPEEIQENMAAAKTYFETNKVLFKKVVEEPTGFSVGYAKYILNYAKKNSVNAFCIMAQVSDANNYIGNTDKENLLLNDASIPVFCANV